MLIFSSRHSGVAGSNAIAAQVAENEGWRHGPCSVDRGAVRHGDRRLGDVHDPPRDALNGAAANLVVDVTPGSVYAHIDQSLGNLAQRHIFKTNVKKFVSLRKADRPIELSDLQKLTVLFYDSTT